MARIITVLRSVPSMIKPPIITLSPVCTNARVLMLLSAAAGAGVAVGLGVAVAVGLGVVVAVGLGVAVAVGLGVPVAVGLGVAVGVAVGRGVGVGVSATTATVPTMLQHPPCGTQ